MHQNNELKSTFIEIVNLKKSNIIVGVIYRNLSVDLTDFKLQLLKQIVREYL